jgi:hypothetical protein
VLHCFHMEAAKRVPHRFALTAACFLVGCAGSTSKDSVVVPETLEPAPAPAPVQPAPKPASTASSELVEPPSAPSEPVPSGTCTVSSLETVPTKESRNDQCRGTFFCPGARTVLVTCDGENDGTNTSLCSCEERGKRASVSGTVPGEAPDSCLAAADRCLVALGK